ncbi:MAG TPA: tryptophan 7-halogenase [Thermoleophilaceae bacterium]|jgi:flavin-dependent dehydrogenase
MPQGNDYEVAVLGGGIAGLTAALQLGQERPQTRIAVIEKQKHPVEETAIKVGESVAEVAAIYLKDVLGLEDYLKEHQHRKMGLRWFCSSGDNDDITRRVEFGSRKYSPLYNFHVDRGGLENHMTELARERGVEVLDGSRVSDVEFAREGHTVFLERDGRKQQLTADWVIDSTGRAAMLRRKLDLGLNLPIDANASWFRIPYQICIDEWSDDPAWREQVPTGTRWKSTISFIGEGYWVWVINLGSGSCSVGVVADPRYVPFDRIRRYDAVIEFLREKEPQLASYLPDGEDELMDFRKRMRFSYGCTRAFSRDRWCLTGEAACFVDPLYSTGLDFTAVGNTLAADLISRGLDGADESEMRAQVRAHNRTMVGLLTFAAPLFEGQLVVYREPQVAGAKFVWDNASYFSVLLNLFKNGLLTDPAFGKSIQDQLALNTQMNFYMQESFRTWARDDWDIRAAGVPVGRDELWNDLFFTATKELSKDGLRAHIARSIARLHSLTREMTIRFCEAAGRPVPDDPFEAVPLGDEQLLEWGEYDGNGQPFALKDDTDVTWHVHPAPSLTAA